MAIKRMEHIGIVVEDLPAATEFFVELGLERGGEGQVEGAWADRIVGLEGVMSDLVMLKSPDGRAEIELVKFLSPPARDGEPGAPSNTLGLRHLSFTVDNLDDVLARLEPHGAELVREVATYRDIYRLCYIRGPAGIIVELAEELG